MENSYTNIPPCKECILLAACRQKLDVDCIHLFNYLTNAQMTGRHEDYRDAWDLVHKYVPSLQLIK
jgi:hypothetical protein